MEHCPSSCSAPRSSSDMLHPAFQGVYHGVFPGEPAPDGPSVWLLSRPHNWRPRTADEALVRISLRSGRLLGRTPIPTRYAVLWVLAPAWTCRTSTCPRWDAAGTSRCRFAHDAVRQGDRVYVASTGDGAILELAYPSLSVVRRHPLFTAAAHLNGLAPTGDGATLWAVLHNRGPVGSVLPSALLTCITHPGPPHAACLPESSWVNRGGPHAPPGAPLEGVVMHAAPQSDLALVDVATGAVLQRLQGVGAQAHGAVLWNAHVLCLDSARGALVRLDAGSGEAATLWQVHACRMHLPPCYWLTLQLQRRPVGWQGPDLTSTHAAQSTFFSICPCVQCQARCLHAGAGRREGVPEGPGRRGRCRLLWRCALRRPQRARGPRAGLRACGL